MPIIRADKPKNPSRLELEMFRGYLLRESMCRFRSEPWELTFADFTELWGPHWHQRGTGSDEMCLTRIDDSLPWRKDNCAVVTRNSYLRRVTQRPRTRRKGRIVDARAVLLPPKN